MGVTQQRLVQIHDDLIELGWTSSQVDYLILNASQFYFDTYISYKETDWSHNYELLSR